MPNAAPDRSETEQDTAPDPQGLTEARNAADGRNKRDYVQGMFSDIAPRYDLLNHVLSMNIDKGWRRKALARLNWLARPNGTYLDLCAGTLDVGATLSKLRGFSGFIIGADFAFPMLKYGWGKASANVLAPVTADAMVLPLGDASLDGAIVAFGIRNVADLDVSLREVYRVLKPGVRFVILEFSTPSSRLVRSLYHAYFHYALPMVGRLVSGHGSAYTYLPLSVSKFPTLQALAGRMKQAGFVSVAFETLTFGIAAIHVGYKPESADSGNRAPSATAQSTNTESTNTESTNAESANAVPDAAASRHT